MKKLLIANRGEIAVRIIRTAKKLGLQTVAVYSAADAHSPHVSLADEKQFLGPAPATESYLHIERLLKAAKESGADSVHPGYGFLSESPEFSEAVKNAGLIFVGPTAEAMRKIGLKHEARHLAQSLNIPTPSGINILDASDLGTEAEKIGFPLLVKAVAGGGGRGMRRVNSATELQEFLAQATREAQASFGDGRLMLEQLISPARHIEIQVVADAHGKVLHFFERDCSLQRRYQKVIESSPAEKLNAAVRQAMFDAACKLATAAGLLGAATVEFLVPLKPKKGQADFYFLEVNPRIQVEHPVTEMVTGVDLIELQIRIARGEQLRLQQSDITLKGAAIEARILAEIPAQQFRPSVGTIRALEFPEKINNAEIRIEHALATGLRIETFYDSLLMKLVVAAKTPSLARQAMLEALEQTSLHGVETNIAFLNRLLERVEETPHTTYIEENIVALSEPVADATVVQALAAAILWQARCFSIDAFPQPFLRSMPLQKSLGTPLFEISKQWRVRSGNMAGEKVLRAQLREKLADGSFLATIDNNNYRLKAGARRFSKYQFAIDNQEIYFSATSDRHGRRIEILLDGSLFVAEIESSSGTDIQDESKNNNAVVAHLPGIITLVKVKVGEKIAAGESCAVLESMKMEHSLNAPRAGIIETLAVSPGTRVKEGEIILTLRVDPTKKK